MSASSGVLPRHNMHTPAPKAYVRSLFDAIAYRYDLLNHLLSGGLDFYWRRRAIEHLREGEPMQILDVATGTGDFALASFRLNPDRVVGVDIAEEMLKRARSKIESRGLEKVISFQTGEAENLAFSSSSFDASIVAFGVRNFENLEKGLREMCRVVKPGGKVVILEFSRPRVFPFSQLYFFYFKNILPLLGKSISRHNEAYEYLPETVLRFPEGEEFRAMLRNAGLTEIREERLTFGVVTVYSAQKKTMTNSRTIRVGHSPDPDDAFMFYGLASGKVKLDGIQIEHQLEDIQSLNERAMRGELEVTAISAHAYAFVADKYWIMRTGASMGEGYGPVIISRKYRTLDELQGKTIGTPGPLTTATLLFKTFTSGIKNVDMPFDRIMEAVDNGTVDAGLIIHEGQITYQSLGYHKVLDFGEYWESETNGLPLPLGLDVVRKDLGEELAEKLSRGLKDSIAYGYAHQDEAIPYAMQWGRGIDHKLGEEFVKMYVSELTIDMGESGKKALEYLYRAAKAKGLIASLPNIEIY